MRNLFLPLFLLFSFCGKAQHISLQNDWQLNSDTVYIGAQNILHIKGDVADIVSFSGDIKSVVYKRDSLFFNVVQLGEVKIKAHFKNGNTQAFSYHDTYLPPLVVQISKGADAYEKSIPKNALLAGCILQPDNKMTAIYSSYEVTSYEILLNGKQLLISGSLLSPKLIAGISELKSGDSFEIVKASLLNKEKRKQMHVGMHKQYKVL